MITIKDFWEEAPLNVIDKNKLDVEATWDEFVKSTNGLKVSSILSKSPDFDNADYIFQEDQVILELKEVVTDFSNSPTFESKLYKLLEQLIKEQPEGHPLCLGEDSGSSEFSMLGQ